jgi:hypothetical protein
VREHLPVSVADGEAGFTLFDGPGRRELAKPPARRASARCGAREAGTERAGAPEDIAQRLSRGTPCLLLVRARQDLQVSLASRRNSVLFSKRSTRLVAGALMKAIRFFLTTTLLISGCTQVNDQFYSKKNFTSESFRADASECKRQNPSFVAIQSYVADSQDRTSNIDDAMVRDCMKAKGYDIRVLTK